MAFLLLLHLSYLLLESSASHLLQSTQHSYDHVMLLLDSYFQVLQDDLELPKSDLTREQILSPCPKSPFPSLPGLRNETRKYSCPNRCGDLHNASISIKCTNGISLLSSPI